MKRFDPTDGKIRILVVEDEVLERHALCQLLEISGYFSTGATNGADALDVVQAFRPQAIIMDLRMPVLDGIGATQRLKASTETRDIPVLVLTGSHDPEDRQQALEAGVDAVLTKPLNLDQLLLFLRQRV